MKRNKLILGVMVLATMVSSITAFGAVDKGSSLIMNEIVSGDISDCSKATMKEYEFTFEDFKKDLKEDLNKDELKKAEKLFKDANDYEKKAKDTWDELYGMDIFDYDEIEYSIEPWTFEDFKIDFKDGLSKDDVEKAEKLFDKAMNLEEKEKYEDANKAWDELCQMDIYDYDEIGYCLGTWTFEDFKIDFKDGLSKDDVEKAEKLFDKAMNLEEKEKYEDANKAWDELCQMDIYDYDEIGYCLGTWTFEDFKIDFKDGLSKDDVEKAEKLFDKAMNLEEKEKYEEANKAWDELDGMDLFEIDEFSDWEIISIDDNEIYYLEIEENNQ